MLSSVQSSCSAVQLLKSILSLCIQESDLTSAEKNHPVSHQIAE